MSLPSAPAYKFADQGQPDRASPEPDPVTSGATPGRPIGIYVHFPWCLAKCPYCDFLSVPADPADLRHRAYADAVIAELEVRTSVLAPGADLKTVFFGGGTPSLWQPEELGRVLRRVLKRFGKKSAEVEVTVECNPSSFDEGRARRWVEQGVGRLSLGVQGLDDRRLAFLGRLHDAAQGLAAVDAAIRAKVPRISADLIFGVAGQTASEAAAEVRAVARRGITHVSAYALTIEPGTAFGARARSGRLPLLGESDVADSFKAVEGALAELGFDHYEISNYATQGHVAKHNLGYWRGAEYLGLGAGAWGTVTVAGAGPAGPVALRYRNTCSPERYLEGHARWAPDGLDRPGDLVQSVERLDGETRLSERILLGLRTREGVDVEAAAEALGAVAFPRSRQRGIERWAGRGMLDKRGGHLTIPQEHWLMADGIIADVM